MASTPKYSRIKRYPTPLVGDLAFFELIDSNLPQNARPVKGQPHHDVVNYPNHKLAHIEPMPKNFDGLQIWHYVCDRAQQDLYNWEFESCSIGGDRFDSVVRTYVIPRDEYDPWVPALCSAMPVFDNDLKSSPLLADPDTNQLGVDVNMFGSGFVLIKKTESRFDDESMDSLYIVEKRQYVKKTTQRTIGFDEQFGGTLEEVVTLFHVNETVPGVTKTVNGEQVPMTVAELIADSDNGYWGLQDDGTVNTATQLSTEWFQFVNKQVVPEFMVTTGRSWSTTIDYNFPPVLDSLQIDIWPMRKGGAMDIVTPIWKRDAYSGPVKATVSEIFGKAAPAASDVVSMQPDQITLQTPLISINTPPCLHGAFFVDISTGTSHPDFYYTAGRFSFDSTTPTDWPEGQFIDSVKTEPFRGGFLTRVVTIYPPADTGSPPGENDPTYTGSIDNGDGDLVFPSIVSITSNPIGSLTIGDVQIPVYTLQNLDVFYDMVSGRYPYAISYETAPWNDPDLRRTGQIYWIQDSLRWEMDIQFFDSPSNTWYRAVWYSADDVHRPDLVVTWEPQIVYSGGPGAWTQLLDPITFDPVLPDGIPVVTGAGTHVPWQELLGNE